MATAAALIAAIIAQALFGKFNDAEITAIRLASTFISQDDPSSKTEATTALVFSITGVVCALGVILTLEAVFNSRHTPISRKVFTLVVSEVRVHDTMKSGRANLHTDILHWPLNCV